MERGAAPARGSQSRGRDAPVRTVGHYDPSAFGLKARSEGPKPPGLTRGSRTRGETRRSFLPGYAKPPRRALGERPLSDYPTGVQRAPATPSSSDEDENEREDSITRTGSGRGKENVCTSCVVFLP